MSRFSSSEAQGLMKEKKADQILEKTKSETSWWSDLPLDLSQKIIDNLYFFSDQICFRAVCRSWRTAQHKKSAAYFLPWIIKLPHHQNNSFECQLYELLNPKPAAVEKISLHQFPNIDMLSSFHIDITYRYGWLLFSITEKDYSYTNFLLFSVLTKEVMTLPPLHHQMCSKFDLIKAFSAEPNSPDCVFVVLQDGYNKRHSISTLSYGGNKWTVKHFYAKSFGNLGSAAVYIRGTFYFVCPLGGVASYNIAREKLKVLCLYGQTIYTVRFRKHEVFELDGDLVHVYSNHNYYGSDLCYIKRFDFSRQAWDCVKCLGDHALFVSHNSIYLSTVGELEEEAKNNGILANSVYWLTPLGCIVYSLKEDGRLVRFRNGPRIANWDTNGYEKLSFWFKHPKF